MNAAAAPAPDPQPTDAAPRPRWAFAALVFGAWTAVGAFSAAQWWLVRATASEPVRPFHVGWMLESMWLWAAFTLLIFPLAYRFPLERGRLARNLPLHGLFALGSCVVDVLADELFVPLLGAEQGSLMQRLIGRSFINVFSYAAIVGIAHAARYYRLMMERRAREAELERQLLQARLQALESQLHPHFLFNTLHTIGSLIRVGEHAAALRMLSGLGDLLRQALRNRDAQEVPLRDELDFVGRYLDVERVRFQDRLRTHVQVDDDVPGDVLVPHLILQPLVENAIRHGVEARGAGGAVEIRVRRDDGLLWMTVRDDGPGPNGNGADGSATGDGSGKANGRGIGLGNTRERLRHLYGDDHRFELGGDAGGAVATIAVPFHRTAAGA
jgi:two-component system LytT family sensor kinase